MRTALLCTVLLIAAALPMISIPHTAVCAIGAPTENYTIPDPTNDPRHDEIKPQQVEFSLSGPSTQTKTTPPNFLTQFTGPIPQAKLTVIGEGKWHLDVDINAPGWLYIYEYYPPGSASSGQWIAYKWQLKPGGDWKLGPFSATENEPQGQHVYRLWFYANGQWASPEPAQSLIYWDYLKAFPELRIDSFTASPLEIKAGDKIRLSWSVYGAQSLEIPGIGPVQGSAGTVEVTPDRTTNFVLLATGMDGRQIQLGAVTVAVLPAASVTAIPTPAVTPVTTPTAQELSFFDQLAKFLSTPLGLIASLVITAILIVLAFLAARIYIRRQQDMDSEETEITLLPVKQEVSFPTYEQPIETRARLLIRNGMEITLTGMSMPVGRADMARALDLDKLALISQGQFQLTCRDGHYSIEDPESTNGTLLNGIDIKGQGQFALKDGDIIEPAGAIQLRFTASTN